MAIRVCFSLTVYCLLMLSVAILPAFGFDIRFHDTNEVTGSQIHLGDIADIVPDNTKGKELALRTVSPSPQPGKTKSLSTSAIKSYLKLTTDLNDSTWKGPSTISVQRRGISVDGDQLKNIIAGFLQKNLNRLPPAAIRFIPTNIPKVSILPYGKLSWEVIPSNPAIIGSSSFSIILKINGKTVENKTVRGKLEAWAEIVVATTTVRKGTLISANNVSMRRQDISMLQEPFFATNNVIGLLAKQTIHPGRVVETRHVQLPPHVKKGERVKIIASNGSLNISTLGIAGSSGRAGDMIRVRNIQSNKLIYCLIEAPGIVSVNF